MKHTKMLRETHWSVELGAFYLYIFSVKHVLLQQKRKTNTNQVLTDLGKQNMPYY